jgi:RimJ/RimL family protein N-acetyltransferase
MPKANGQWLLEPIIVTTERLTVRPFDAADVSATYLSWLNDGEHMRFSNQRFETHTRDSALEYLSSFGGIDSVFLAIELSDHAQLVGTATVFANVNHGTADIGVMIGSEQEGRGFARESVRAIMEALDTQGFRKITIGTSAQNVGMLRVIESLGFHPDGVKLRQEIINGAEVDVLYFARFPGDASNC